MRVAVENGLVRYYINNTAVHTSTATPTYPLLVDTSILTAGKKISGVVLCAPCHVYYYHQDHLGSVRALTDSTARLVATYNYDAYGRRNYTNNNGIGSAASAGNINNQPVSWTNAISVTSAPTLTFNTIQKTAGPDNVWNAGAVSTQQIRGGDGYVEVRLEATLTYRQIGLSHGDTDQSPADIDFAAYLRATDFKVIEGGVEKYWLQQVLVAGDVVRVAVEGGKVKYYINSTAVYTSTATPTYPLLVDSSISLIGTKLVNVYLCTPCLVSEAVAAPAGTTSVSSVYNPFGYAGEYADAESGLIYLRARYYDPSTQQFLTVDPLVAQTGQAYDYAGGSPLNFRDPSGLDANCSWFPNPWDDHSCISEGFSTPEGKATVAAGTVFGSAVILACIASGVCAAAAAAVGIGASAGAGAAPKAQEIEGKLAPVVNDLAPVAEDGAVQICEESTAHIFRNALGHFAEDTAENRQALIDTLAFRSFSGWLRRIASEFSVNAG